jgi:N-6 DNA Methylase
MPRDPAILAHQEWLGYVQPTGLVVSIPSLIDASAFLNRNYGPEHHRLLSALPQESDGSPVPEISDFARFAQDVLGWDGELMLGSPGADPVPPELEVNLENYNETLRPSYALRNLNGEGKWLLLVELLPNGTDLDAAFAPHDRGWQASPQARFERLLRQTGVHIGLLVNGRQIRLVYAPEKELSGHITFNLGDMVKVAGRPIFAALQMLLGAERLYSVADKERLPAILANSRKYQNVVSTQLATQVLEALYELLRGFQAANDQSKGDLLRAVLARDPDHVYRGLLTTLLRLVFVLFAEDRGLLSTDPVYSNYYSITGLYERLRADAGRYPDTMDQRYGAWAQLLALFGLMYSGGSHGAMKIPAREGYLFDPGRYLFLEGRHDKKDKPEIPRVSDGVVYRVLTKLLLLDGERLSYRTLAVEQIGSVYQAIMGFSLQVATGRSIAIKPAKKHGAPATVNLEQLLATSADKRLKRFTDETDQKLTGQAADALKSAKTIEDLMPAIQRKIATTVTPTTVPKGAMIFQPSDERRKSGSHYTPSSLTGPIVEAALGPVLKQLGPNATPAQILNLKVCDLAMGSAAFLVEACRQLGDELSKAWHSHGEAPSIPLDEDEALYAQRLIAQRCLYGLDKNQMAADLAKLSLWLATLAKDHPFTFLDHSLRHGDALVGLTRKQIASFNWAPAEQKSFLEEEIRKRIDRATQYRQRILNARDDVSYAQLSQELISADEALNLARMMGDATIAAFFSGDRPKKREEVRRGMQSLVEADLKKDGFISVDGELDSAIKTLRTGIKGIVPFHWELEFPEVFSTDENGKTAGGFDAIVGNPPFMSGTRISEQLGMNYFGWLTSAFPPAGHLCDLVAYFFRRSFDLLRTRGCFGLIATNTIAQGDTREGSLVPILASQGRIFSAMRRLRWPGEAAVVVSRVHVSKGLDVQPVLLNGKCVTRISAFLLDGSVDASPRRLAATPFFSAGSKIYGQGFLFDDRDPDANPSELQRRVLGCDSRYASRILPYIGGEQVNSDPSHQADRAVIFLSDIKDENELNDWPMLADIVRAKVKPERDLLGNNPNNVPLKRRWWAYQAHRPELYARIRKLERVLVNSQVSGHLAFAFLPSSWIYAHTLNVFDIADFSAFSVLQSRPHEIWARFLGSSMKDDLRYTASDCFETFPFPRDYTDNSTLCEAGRRYYEFRAALMTRRGEGLTKTYNRFNDPEESSGEIAQLRELHDSMDRPVLDAYGWAGVLPKCDFMPEFEEDDEEEEDSEHPRKKKYRYRWPDEIRDKVLAGLLELNHQRSVEEGQSDVGQMAMASTPETKPKAINNKKSKKKKAMQDTAASLFAVGEGEA